MYDLSYTKPKKSTTMQSLFWPSFTGMVAMLVLFNYIDYHLAKSELPTHIDGTVDARYARVQKAFINNFGDGWERDGASVAVFVDGKKVVDLWGGYADKQSARKWQEDTMSITFSTTKAVAAVCVALLVEKKRLRYDDLVSKYWPEFGKHGKQNITIQMALSHESGLGYLDTEITEEIAADHNKMRRVLENEAPKWVPGSMNGYHPYTYGWLVDQIVRHADEKRRGIGQFLREEITEPNGIDYHIGLSPSQSYRVARLSLPSSFDHISEIMTDWRVSMYLSNVLKLLTDTPLARAVNNPSWLQMVSKCTANNPDFHRLEQAGALGIGNARSLASIFDLVLREKIVSRPILNDLQMHYSNSTDYIFGDLVAKGHGFFYLPHGRAGTEFLVGHNGHGCQQIVYDLKNKVTIAYVSNGLKTGVYDLCRTYKRLQNAVYDVIEGVPEL